MCIELAKKKKKEACIVHITDGCRAVSGNLNFGLAVATLLLYFY